MSNLLGYWWELEDGSIVAVKPDNWVCKYTRVVAPSGSVYWYYMPRATKIQSPINQQDLPETMEMVLFLLGDS